MADPMDSHYQPPPPIDEDGGDSGYSDPDQGKDMTYLIPDVHAEWGDLPSFNSSALGGGSGDKLDATSLPHPEPFAVDLTGMHAAGQSMLMSLHQGVDAYETLRGQVLGIINNFDFYGPPLPPSPEGGSDHIDGQFKDADDNALDKRDERALQATLHKNAVEFMSHINPAQEKVLEQIANALSVTGKYIGLLTMSGQSYGAIDKAARLPSPPGATPQH